MDLNNMMDKMVSSYCHYRTVEFFDYRYKIVESLKEYEEFMDSKTLRSINRYLKNGESIKSLLLTLEEPPEMTKKEFSRFTMLDKLLDYDFEVITKYLYKTCRDNNIDIESEMKKRKTKETE